MNARSIVSQLNTITVRVHSSEVEKFKLLVDTEAEISIVKGASLKSGVDYEPTKGINVRGISNALLRTEGTATLKLLTQTHETTHTFHIMGNSFECNYDGILGQDFWQDKRAINYCDRKITMGEVTINFDDETNRAVRETYRLTRKTRPEKRTIAYKIQGTWNNIQERNNTWCIFSRVTD
jgi:hypothetical protein